MDSIYKCNNYEDLLNRLSYNMNSSPEIYKSSILYKLSNNFINGVVANLYVTLFIFSVIGVCIYNDELRNCVIKLSELILKFLEQQRKIIRHKIAMCESNKGLLIRASGTFARAYDSLRSTVKYLSNLFIKRDQTKTCKKVAETIVVIGKILRNNPGLNKECLTNKLLNSSTKTLLEIITQRN